MPVRTAKFIARKNWIVTGADDLVMRIYNYNTGEKVAHFEGHADYIRCFAVHPTRPFVLSASDDMTVKLWDWERGWRCVSTFEGHAHYVMAVVFNPKDNNTFATASLDTTIKVWSLSATTAHYTLEGHEKGVNCVAYYGGGDRPYLVSGADDATVRIWDYQSKACVRVLEGHTQNVSATLFHPDLPLILSASEDSTVKVWSLNTFRPEATFNFSLDRVWALAVRPKATEIAVGCDEGAIVFQLGKGEPAASMEANGKLVWSRHNEILTGNIKHALSESPDHSLADGQRLFLPSKELGNCDVYPQLLQHSPTGRFVAVCGDGEYIVYTALAWRNKAYGKGLELAWAAGVNNDYVVRESTGKLAVFTNFVETGAIRIASSCEQVFGGVLIGAACAGGQLAFFDWSSCQLVRRIDVEAKRVLWSEESQQVAICGEQSLYLLQYNEGAVREMLSHDQTVPEDGLEAAFDLIDEIDEKVLSGLWVGGCFVFVTATNRLCYTVGGQRYQIALSERPLHLVGYLQAENRLVCVDKDVNVITFALSMAVIDYETAILRADLPAAAALASSIPADQVNKVAHFLKAQGHSELALSLATDGELKFELAVQLKRLDLAYDLASQTDSTHKWRELGDLALKAWKIALAEKCFLKSTDLASLLLLYASSGNTAGLLSLASMALEQHQHNIAFSCYFCCGKREECFELLVRTQRLPEAALFARTYLPTAVDRAVALWREQLASTGRHRVAKYLADPSSHPRLFPEHDNDLAAFEAVCVAASHRDPSAFRSRSASFDSTVAASERPDLSYKRDEANKSPSSGFPSVESHSMHSTHSTHLPSFSPYYEPAISDHLSLEVNTGNGSMRADDLDDLTSVSVSETRDDLNVPSAARNLERLSIQELEEEHAEEGSFPAMRDPVGPARREKSPTLDRTMKAAVDVTREKEDKEDTVSEGFKTPQEGSLHEVAKIDNDEIVFDDDGWD